MLSLRNKAIFLKINSYARDISSMKTLNEVTNTSPKKY